MTEYQKLDQGMLLKYIREQVASHWSITNRALLLSSLGQQINHHQFDLKAILAGRKLADLISKELSDHVTIIQSQKTAPWIGALPKNVLIHEDIEKYFIPINSNTLEQEQIPLFPAVFWAAFTRSLSQSKIRTIELTPKIKYFDLDETSLKLDGRLRIERDYIITTDQSHSDFKVQVFDKIKSWLKKNNISKDYIAAIADKKPTTNQLTPNTGTSLLDQLLRALSSDQLHRTQLPLDVIATLLKK
jgi:hypothetical protein